MKIYQKILLTGNEKKEAILHDIKIIREDLLSFNLDNEEQEKTRRADLRQLKRISGCLRQLHIKNDY